jgi:hypothetical protein
VDTGIFFKAASKEIVRALTSGERPFGDEWGHVSDDSALGLVEIRSLLIERGLVDDRESIAVYWRLAPRRPARSSPTAA